MPELIGSPTLIEASGNKPKIIREYVGVLNTGDTKVSIAQTRSPGGWQEPWECDDYHQYALVLEGMLRVEGPHGVIEAEAGQAIHTKPGERIRYTTPREDGAEYILVCVPAHSRARVYRD